MVSKQGKYIHWNFDGMIATITIDHPPLNILKDELLTEFSAVLEHVLTLKDLRSFIITGSGEKAFVAGADILQFLDLDKTTGKQLVRKGKEIFDRIERAPIPSICAINGLALGGGLELALACDIRIAEEHVKLGLPETSLGIIPGYGGTQRLSYLVGQGKAKELIFTGSTIKAQEAYNIGLVEQVVPTNTSLKHAQSIAEVIASNGPIAIAYAKKAIDQHYIGCTEEGQQTETMLFSKLCETEDMSEGVQAFLEKRSPNFTGN